jgi:peptidoglycan/LPS O-acetylase OafA/YrhL
MPPDGAQTERCRRPPVASTVYMPQICRGVACLLVAVYHGAGLVDHHYGVDPLRGLSRFGFSGVHMFFVISGLIIYHAHRRDLGDARNAPRYLLKRLVRIYPFYWIAFLALGGRKVFSGRLEIGDFLTNALFFSASESLVIAVAWTLAYEMIFYGIFLAFLVKRALGIAVFAAWFVLVALNHHHRFAESIGLELLNVLFMLGLLTSVAVIALRRRWDARRRDQLGV